MKKLLVLGIIILLVGMSFPSTGIIVEKSTVSNDGKTLYVGGSGPGNYTKIQDAIDNSTDGDTVFVYSGTYVGHVFINKSINLIGEDKNTTIISGFFAYTMYVVNDRVNISRFTIQNNGRNGEGIRIDSSYSKIINNIIELNQDAIRIYGNNNTISDNNITGDSIYLYGEGNIINNNIITNAFYGIYLSNYYPNIISDNSFFNSGLYISEGTEGNNYVVNNMINGKPLIFLYNKSDLVVNSESGQIILAFCTNISIQNQEIFNTNIGIQIYYSNNCLIFGNTINHNLYGISLQGTNNKINQNKISNNNYSGIRLLGINNTFNSNNISNNYRGIYIGEKAKNNIFFHNNFENNSINTYDTSTNIWDNGYPSGGNYWDDYPGEDKDGDGIGDTPYLIPGEDNQDRYPLMEPYGTTLLIGNVKFGSFKQRLLLKNIGDHTAFNIQWSIRIDGGLIFFGRESLGNVSNPLLKNEEVVVTSELLLFGLGSIRITIDVWADNIPSDSETIKGRLFLFLLMI